MPEEFVILVNENNEVIGQAPKSTVHTSHTPLHRAFSIFLFNSSGQLLLQQRNHNKKTWPLVWSNSCCGHPAPGEKTSDAARRRLAQELSIYHDQLYPILPNYRYRAELNGVVENELCPVFVAFTDSLPQPDPVEVENIRWVIWDDFLKEVTTAQPPYSPWCIEETQLLAENQEFHHLFEQRTTALT